MSTNESTTYGKIPSRQALYSKIANRGDEIIEGLFTLSKDNNAGIRLGALKELASRILPELKAIEITGENGEPIRFNIISGSGFLPPGIKVNATPITATVPEQQEIQSTDLAPTSA